jgi:hypothetical protein
METKPNSKLVSLLSRAFSRQAEASVAELFDILALPESMPILKKLIEVREFCNIYELELLPELDQGDLRTIRCVRSRSKNFITAQQAKEEILRGEGPQLEFKSSLIYDYARARNDPSAKLDDLRSENVLHSSMKTVAAFLNSSGGVLYIGVDDVGAPLGIDVDLLFLKPEKRNIDNWELTFRELVGDRFYEGRTVNDYVRVSVLNIEHKNVVRAEVSARNKLSFVKVKSKEHFVLYRRQGNRTIEVTIENVEEFIASRRSLFT